MKNDHDPCFIAWPQKSFIPVLLLLQAYTWSSACLLIWLGTIRCQAINRYAADLFWLHNFIYPFINLVVYFWLSVTQIVFLSFFFKMAKEILYFFPSWRVSTFMPCVTLSNQCSSCEQWASAQVVTGHSTPLYGACMMAYPRPAMNWHRMGNTECGPGDQIWD